MIQLTKMIFYCANTSPQFSREKFDELYQLAGTLFQEVTILKNSSASPFPYPNETNPPIIHNHFPNYPTNTSNFTHQYPINKIPNTETEVDQQDFVRINNNPQMHNVHRFVQPENTFRDLSTPNYSFPSDLGNPNINPGIITSGTKSNLNPPLNPNLPLENNFTSEFNDNNLVRVNSYEPLPSNEIHYTFKSLSPINNNQNTNTKEAKNRVTQTEYSEFDINIVQPWQKRKRKKLTSKGNLHCTICKETETPEWRKGPEGNHTLCNACGLNYAKKMKIERSNLETKGRRRQSIDNILETIKYDVSKQIESERAKKFEKKKSKGSSSPSSPSSDNEEEKTSSQESDNIVSTIPPPSENLVPPVTISNINLNQLPLNNTANNQFTTQESRSSNNPH